MGCLLLAALSGTTQNLSGDWAGWVCQTGSTDTFQYRLTLVQQGEAVTGQAVSTSASGSMEAAFQVSGRWKDGHLILQEVEQLRPAAPKWCMKYLQLTAATPNASQLTGNWTATGCQPGSIALRRVGTASAITSAGLTFPGRWTGHLSQSDRDYGFYYDMMLQPDGTGTSHIVSEEAGGEATHQLRWEAHGDTLVFEELHVQARTQAQWKWCLKSAALPATQGENAYELTGKWAGYLEHKTPQSGACAPGTMFLTRPPDITPALQQVLAPQTNSYTTDQGRSVRIDRVLKVASKNIRIRVWDNGVVDGDILTLFLNGKQILSKYRVNKRKWTIPVDILDGENLLILHAEDLGNIPPNTVAVSIYDGTREQVVVLSSNLAESGAILIQPFVF